jgi:hypothetical protein
LHFFFARLLLADDVQLLAYIYFRGAHFTRFTVQKYKYRRRKALRC